MLRQEFLVLFGQNPCFGTESEVLWKHLLHATKVLGKASFLCESMHTRVVVDSLPGSELSEHVRRAEEVYPHEVVVISLLS